MLAATDPPQAAERQPLVFGPADAQLFGWLHEPDAGALDVAVLVCGAIGIEYVNAYRALRHLADALAALGFYALRFDYLGAGDSAQDETDPDRVAHWNDSIVAAAEALRAHSGCARVAAVGLRFGATLASVAAARAGITELVLWNPVLSGKHYVREMRAVAALAGYKVESGPGQLESAGFVYTAQTLRDIQEMDLLALPFDGIQRALVIERDDLGGDTRLGDHLRQLGVAHEVQRQPGYDRMVCESLFTEVPQQAIDAIGAWLKSGARPVPGAERAAARVEPGVIELGCCRELPLLLGPRKLFGVWCTPGGETRNTLLVLLNSGVDHHVGPGRLHVKLARALAAEGFASVRLDIGGVGDSAARGNADLNRAFPPNAVAELVEVLPELARRCGRQRIVLSGICAGAYHAFAVAQHDVGVDLPEVILLNPVQFEPERNGDAQTEVDAGRAAAFERRQLRRRLARAVPGSAPLVAALRFLRDRLHRARLRTFAALRGQGAAGGGATGLANLRRQGRCVTLLVSPADPGLELLQLEAPGLVRRGLREGWIGFQTIDDADHVFSSHATRARLLEKLLARLRALG